MLLRTARFAACIITAVCGMNVDAAELALLRNGYEIRHETRESIGQNTRLYLNADRTSGYIEVASDQIVGFEKDESPSAPPSLPAPKHDATSPNKSIDVQATVAAASKAHGIDPDLIASVIHAESSFNPRAVSAKGAQGLMQLMPETASALHVKNSFDVDANVDGGTRYLRELLVRYNDDLQKALAAYNAGPHRVDQYKGVPPYRETRQFVARVIRDFNSKKTAIAAKRTPSSKVETREARRP